MGNFATEPLNHIDIENEKISKIEATYPVNLSIINLDSPLIGIKKIYHQLDHYVIYPDATKNLDNLDNKHTQSKSL